LNKTGILALDIGGGKLAGVVGAVTGESFHVLSAGVHNQPSGFKNGRVVDLKQALSDIKQTIARICYFSSVPIDYLVINIALKNSDFDFCQQGVLFPTALSEQSAPYLAPFLQLAECLDIQLLGFVPNALAGSKILLKAEEKGGALLLDCGQNFVQGALFQKGECRQLFELPLGGKHLTHDLAYGLKISQREAESIKIRYSSEPMTLDMAVSHQFIAEIIEARLREIFALVCQKINPFSLDQACLVVLTGGMSRTRGALEIGKEVFGDQVVCRYHPVPECKLAIGSDWEIGPVGTLAFALEHQAVRARLQLSCVSDGARLRFTRPANQATASAPGASTAEPTNQEEAVISPVRVQPAKVSWLAQTKSLLESIF
jgi:cell division ATPase FtsA